MANNILCATDGSEHSKVAIDYAVDLAKSTRSNLTFLVVNIVVGGLRGPLNFQRSEAELKNVLDDAKAVAIGVSDVKAVAVKSRDPAWAIVQYAEENSFDHIVTGTGDRSVISRLVLGSVAREVVAKAHCSVTVAR